MLDDAIKGHKPHPKSLLDEESKEAYNEKDARQGFGDEFIDQLKKDQPEFMGDWWQLALLVRNLENDKQNPPSKAEHRLKAWNEWRPRQGMPWRRPAYEYTHLEHAYLLYARLEHVSLGGAHLEQACLAGAYLEHADLRSAHLEQAELEGADIEHANLSGTHLEHASLESAHLEHAYLGGAHLEHAHLFRAYFEHANLWGAHLKHADLQYASLNGADLRGVEGLLFNDNRFEGIHIEGKAPDPWSILRRKYTGPWFFVHLLLLAIFFAPYVGHALYLTGKSQFQEWSIEQYNALGERVADLPGVGKYQREVERRFFDEHVHRPAVWVLLGLHRGVIPITLAAIVILYNVFRGCLTLRISTLRDAEERSSITPTLEEYYGLCHPLADTPGIKQVLPTWWRSHGEWRWLAWPRWLTVPGWIMRRLDAVSRLTKLKTPYSLIDCFGLYRLHHLVARILLWAAVLAVVYNTLAWMDDTWIWVPKSA